MKKMNEIPQSPLGSDTGGGPDVQKTVEVPQLQCSDKVVDVLVVQVVAVPQVQFCGSRTVKVPQTQFIAGVGLVDISVRNRDGHAFSWVWRR